MSHLICRETINISEIFSGVHGFTGKTVKVRQIKRPIVNKQRVIYKFQYDLCDASYVAILSGTCTNAWLNTLNSLFPWANTSLTNTVLSRKTRAVIFPFSGSA